MERGVFNFTLRRVNFRIVFMSWFWRLSGGLSKRGSGKREYKI